MDPCPGAVAAPPGDERLSPARVLVMVGVEDPELPAQVREVVLCYALARTQRPLDCFPRLPKADVPNRNARHDQPVLRYFAVTVDADAPALLGRSVRRMAARREHYDHHPRQNDRMPHRLSLWRIRTNRQMPLAVACGPWLRAYQARVAETARKARSSTKITR